MKETDVADSLGLLFSAPSGQHHCGFGPAQHPGGLEQFGFRHPGNPLHPLRPVGSSHFSLTRAKPSVRSRM